MRREAARNWGESVITTRRQVLAASVVPVAAIASLLAGSPAHAGPAVPSTAAVSAASTAAVSAASTAAPSTAAAASAAAPVLRPGSKGKAVLAAQRRLAALGYWHGKPDGVYGPATMHAVTALQKVAGLARDGVLGPRTAKALASGVRPKAASTRGHVVEIDLARQVLLVVRNGKVRYVLDASTGSGKYYTVNGVRKHAVTPKGTYRIFRGVDGWDPGPLGSLYRPRYFNGGIAVHGYPSVPSYPASHGCVRVTLGAMDLLWSSKLLPVGRRVLVR
jgi:lipoprotein-anchoring transpeptidase ErfK/SrfK